MYKLFISVGSRFPMDRLISSVDSFVGTRDDVEGFAQVGNSSIETIHLSSSRFLDNKEFIEKVIHADLIISHAGMGNILLARENQKNIIILPRKSAHGEHIDDHQVDTVKGMKSYPGIFVLDTEGQIPSVIEKIISQSTDLLIEQSNEKMKLIQSLKSFIVNC
jgi:UDP-N-acetylglucosamine transferase subunit ALG13